MESTPVSGKDGTKGSSQGGQPRPRPRAPSPRPPSHDRIPKPRKSLEIQGGRPRPPSHDRIPDPRINLKMSERPSHVRIPEPRKSLKIQVGDRMTKQCVPGRSVVIIRPRATSSQLNLQDEKIVEEEAVCKFCSDVFKEENTLKTVCKCKNALIHKECADKWIRKKGNNNCDVCGKKVENFPVTLLRGLSSTRRVDAKEKNKNCLFSCFGR